MSKRSSFVFATILIFSALAYSIWGPRENPPTEATPSIEKVEEQSTSSLPMEETPPAPETKEITTPKKTSTIAKSSVVRKSSSNTPAEQLPNSPFLTGNPQQTVAVNTPISSPPTAAPAESSETTKTETSNVDWIELEAATRYASQTHSQNTETSKTHLNPLALILSLSHSITRSCAVELSWRQDLQGKASSSDNFPMNRLSAGFSYSPQKTFFTATRIQIQGGLERSLEATFNDSDSPAAYREYTALNFYGGGTWSQPLNALWSLDIQLLFRQPLLKPDGFSSYTENGWSVLLKPGYQLDESTKVGFKLGYESKTKNFEWSSGPGNTRGNSAENDIQVGFYIRFTF